MAVLPQNADVDKYLADAVARHDHKAFQDTKTVALQGPRRSAEAEESEVVSRFPRAPAARLPALQSRLQIPQRPHSFLSHIRIGVFTQPLQIRHARLVAAARQHLRQPDLLIFVPRPSAG